MNRSSFALVVALLIHLLFSLLYLRVESIKFNKEISAEDKSRKRRISLRDWDRCAGRVKSPVDVGVS